MSTLVIGGTGFIGPRVIRRLLERGEEVVCMDINPGAASFEGLDEKVKVVPGRPDSVRGRAEGHHRGEAGPGNKLGLPLGWWRGGATSDHAYQRSGNGQLLRGSSPVRGKQGDIRQLPCRQRGADQL